MTDKNIEEKIRRAKRTSDLVVIVGMILFETPIIIFGVWLGVPWGFTVFAVVCVIIVTGVGRVVARNMIEQILRNRKDN